jgi:prepilin-type N-terminal cleavage/methylation domain-containing protein
MKTTPMKTASSEPPLPARGAFTLIELLVVISVIALLAGLTFGVVKGVLRNKYINNAKADMTAIEAALERYHSVYGVYPPSANGYVMLNSLYFELVGTTSGTANGTVTFTNLDGSYLIASNNLMKYAGVPGIVNCTRGSGDDLVPAKTFLPNLRANQVSTVTNPPLAILVTSVGGPDQKYQPLGLSGVNPIRYNSSSPTNNPGSYDLYVQLVINGQTNLICNWTKQVQINNPNYP